jgi:cortactin
MKKLREETEQSDASIKKKQHDEVNPGYGYGGKYGVEKDRVDKSAAGWDHIEKVKKNPVNQTEYFIL